MADSLIRPGPYRIGTALVSGRPLFLMQAVDFCLFLKGTIDFVISIVGRRQRRQNIISSIVPKMADSLIRLSLRALHWAALVRGRLLLLMRAVDSYRF
jgi:hypothetical protein